MKYSFLLILFSLFFTQNTLAASTYNCTLFKLKQFGQYSNSNISVIIKVNKNSATVVVGNDMRDYKIIENSSKYLGLYNSNYTVVLNKENSKILYWHNRNEGYGLCQ